MHPAVMERLIMEAPMHERLAKITEVSEQDLNLAEAALLIAMDEYPGLDVEAYRRERLKAFVELLGHFGLNRPPVNSEMERSRNGLEP